MSFIFIPVYKLIKYEWIKNGEETFAKLQLGVI